MLLPGFNFDLPSPITSGDFYQNHDVLLCTLCPCQGTPHRSIVVKWEDLNPFSTWRYEIVQGIITIHSIDFDNVRSSIYQYVPEQLSGDQ